MRRLPDALGSYAGQPVARFHMPGHKGRGMRGFFRPELALWDVTELSFSDSLHAPCGCIADAQAASAAQYGAAHTFFLVNGSTAGLHALLLSLPRGARLLMGRDCHRAAIAGAALAGHTLRFIEPEHIQDQALYGCVSPAALDAALCAHPADAVLLTSPNYYGFCADIPALSRVIKKHGALFFLDAAHGAHFPYSSLLPGNPAGYADAWVNSAHKTLNALGQAALLHIGRGVDVPLIQRALAMVETSSPSYLLLTSLDWARYTAGLTDAWTDTVHACRMLCTRIDGLLGLKTLRCPGTASVLDKDSTRLVVDVTERGLTGYQALKALEGQGVFLEMADERRVVCICTPADDPAWYGMLIDALEALPYRTPDKRPPRIPPPRGEAVLGPCEAARAPVERVALHEAGGRTAADAAGIYPPGVPLWVPGERITDGQAAYLHEQSSLGASLFGVNEACVMVVCEAGLRG